MASAFPPSLEKYLASRAVSDPWTVEGNGRRDFSGAVVIPALAEGEHLFATLRSLVGNPPEHLSRILVLVVVNHRADAAPVDKARNLQDLRRLAAGERDLEPLSLAWVDAASPGRELPERDGGVGLARKIGFDLALTRLDFGGSPPVLAALDADTLVRPDYLPALFQHFRAASAGGAVIPFRHQKGADPKHQAAIDRYELFLRSYVLGLSLAGSPYAFHTIGSTMACRAEAYARMGGMNRRPAGEDFYFLQQLAKTSGVAFLRGTMVFPSARVSRRVPFGTGPTVRRLLAGEPGAVLFYPPDCFRLLGAWLTLATQHWQSPGTELLGRAVDHAAPLGKYLEEIDFPVVWGRLQRNHRQKEAFMAAFHRWFDGLKTLKLIRHLCASPLPRVEPSAALSGLLRWAGLEPAGEIGRQLDLLQARESGEKYFRLSSC